LQSLNERFEFALKELTCHEKEEPQRFVLEAIHELWSTHHQVSKNTNCKFRTYLIMPLDKDDGYAGGQIAKDRSNSMRRRCKLGLL